MWQEGGLYLGENKEIKICLGFRSKWQSLRVFVGMGRRVSSSVVNVIFLEIFLILVFGVC